MKWTDLEIRLKNLIGISADTDIEPEAILTKLEDMVNAASTVIEEKESVQDLSTRLEELSENVQSMIGVVTSHKEAIEGISNQLEDNSKKTAQDIESLSKAVLKERKNNTLVESLTITKDKAITETEEEESKEITMDTNIMLKAKQTQSWPKL